MGIGAPRAHPQPPRAPLRRWHDNKATRVNAHVVGGVYMLIWLLQLPSCAACCITVLMHAHAHARAAVA